MTGRRRAGLVGAATAMLLGVAGPAHAETYLSDADATLLASRLAEASAHQGVCYGWQMTVAGFAGRLTSGTEQGSNLGAGMRASGEQCAKSVMLVASVTITAETSEQEDSAFWLIEATLPDAPTVADLAALGYEAADLLDDDGDQALTGAVLALPRLVSDTGQAPALPEATPAAGGPAGEPTDRPLPEVIRQHGVALIVGGLLVIAGVLLAVQVRYGVRLSARARRAASRPPAAAQWQQGSQLRWWGSGDPSQPTWTRPAQPQQRPGGAAPAAPASSSPAAPPEPTAPSGPVAASGAAAPTPPGPADPSAPPAAADSDNDPRPPSSEGARPDGV